LQWVETDQQDFSIVASGAKPICVGRSVCEGRLRALVGAVSTAAPRGDKQTQRGAVNRARAAREEAHADFGVGLEGGIIENEFGTMTCAWCAIVDRAGRVGIGGSTNMLLPDEVAARVKRGDELGDAMDAFANIRGVKRKMGAIGVLTKGLSNRQRAYEYILKLAVARFLWKGKYGK
jgi:inosine/xanthosine triphosphatase